MLKRNSDVRRFLSYPVFLLLQTLIILKIPRFSRQLCWLDVIYNAILQLLSSQEYILSSHWLSCLLPDTGLASQVCVAPLSAAAVPISLYSKYLFSIIVNICGNA